ncbi:MAG: hypothetical protein M0002_12795 [Rhodospirillales bacterium]|nr:hypothetical protein [Rhodospirillales bacterium]
MRAGPRQAAGTMFRLYPAYADGFAEPERVELSPPAGSLRPGPADGAMATVNPLRKDRPYDPPGYMPPYRGPVHHPALPDAGGHFDTIPVESEQFLAAHTYGSVRRTLDIWEAELGHRIVWWHADFLPLLELIPMVQWANAHSGPGFLEMGRQPTASGGIAPFCLDYDVLAHETGHAILFSQIGTPEAGTVTREFLAFHESFADLIAIIGILHFRAVAAHVLRETEGDLYRPSDASRIGIISRTEQIRMATSAATMADVADVELAPDGSWIDPSGQHRNQHAIAEPLTGAVFDILVEFYQDALVRQGLIAPAADARGWTRQEVARDGALLDRAFADAFARFEPLFRAALDRARDLVAACIAHVMLTLKPETLTFARVTARFLEAAAAQGEAPLMPALLGQFLRRGIDPRPHLEIAVRPGRVRRLSRARGRLIVPEAPNRVRGCACGDWRSFLAARRLMIHPHREQAVVPG